MVTNKYTGLVYGWIAQHANLNGLINRVLIMLTGKMANPIIPKERASANEKSLFVREMSAYPCSGLENCVHINHNANDVWNDQKCTWRMGYICQYYVSGSPLQPPQPPADGACPNDQWLKYAGICYYQSHKDKAINTAAEVFIFFKPKIFFENHFFRPSATQCLAQAHQ